MFKIPDKIMALLPELSYYEDAGLDDPSHPSHALDKKFCEELYTFCQQTKHHIWSKASQGLDFDITEFEKKIRGIKVDCIVSFKSKRQSDVQKEETKHRIHQLFEERLQTTFNMREIPCKDSLCTFLHFENTNFFHYFTCFPELHSDLELTDEMEDFQVHEISYAKEIQKMSETRTMRARKFHEEKKRDVLGFGADMVLDKKKVDVQDQGCVLSDFACRTQATFQRDREKKAQERGQIERDKKSNEEAGKRRRLEN